MFTGNRRAGVPRPVDDPQMKGDSSDVNIGVHFEFLMLGTVKVKCSDVFVW